MRQQAQTFWNSIFMLHVSVLIHNIISITFSCFSSYLWKHNWKIFSCIVPKQVLEFSEWLHAYQSNNKVSFGWCFFCSFNVHCIVQCRLKGRIYNEQSKLSKLCNESMKNLEQRIWMFSIQMPFSSNYIFIASNKWHYILQIILR